MNVPAARKRLTLTSRKGLTWTLILAIGLLIIAHIQNDFRISLSRTECYNLLVVPFMTAMGTH